MASSLRAQGTKAPGLKNGDLFLEVMFVLGLFGKASIALVLCLQCPVSACCFSGFELVTKILPDSVTDITHVI